MKQWLCAAALVLAVAASAPADEIRLKDGSKIIGTIVDFENDSFKVQTAYGFAMVRRDSITQIIPSETSKPGETAKAGSAPAPAAPRPAIASTTQTPTVSPRTVAAPATLPLSPALAPAALAMPAPNPRPARASVAAVPTPALASAPAAAPALAVPPTPAAAPPPPPVVAGPIRESVQGNLYTNQTYSFQLYRPPSWELIPEARKAMPNAITAMGTSDETTLFIVGREPVRDSLETQAGNAQKALQRVYENYRQVSSSKRTVAGLPAVQWQFRGVADGHDWSVTALTVARGADVFTLLGMTYAESDLIQIRENVIGKMIASLQFSPTP